MARSGKISLLLLVLCAASACLATRDESLGALGVDAAPRRDAGSAGVDASVLTDPDPTLPPVDALPLPVIDDLDAGPVLAADAAQDAGDSGDAGQAHDAGYAGHDADAGHNTCPERWEPWECRDR
jgi:hypothetical protein